MNSTPSSSESFTSTSASVVEMGRHLYLQQRKGIAPGSSSSSSGSSSSSCRQECCVAARARAAPLEVEWTAALSCRAGQVALAAAAATFAASRLPLPVANHAIRCVGGVVSSQVRQAVGPRVWQAGRQAGRQLRQASRRAGGGSRDERNHAWDLPAVVHLQHAAMRSRGRIGEQCG